MVSDEVDGQFDAELCNHFLERENSEEPRNLRIIQKRKAREERDLGIFRVQYSQI